MPTSNNKEIAQAYVRLMPVIDGLSNRISQQINSENSGIQSSGKKIGGKLGNGIKSGIQSANIPSAAQVVDSAFVKVFKGILTVARGVFTRIGRLGGQAIVAGFRGVASQIRAVVSTSVKTAALAGGATLAAVLGTGLKSGLDRSMALNSATAKMKGLGYQGQALKNILKSATDSVDGLAFSTGDAATAAVGLLASGVQPGKELTKVLRTIGDTASLTESDFGDIGSIFNKVFASGIVQGDDLAQLTDRGVPVLTYLAKSLHVTAAAAKKMASDGKISAKQFAQAMSENLDGLGEKMAQNSFKLAFKNVRSQLGRVFQPIFDSILTGATPMLNSLRSKIKSFVTFLSPILAPIQENIKTFFAKLSVFIDKVNIGKYFSQSTGVLKQFKDALIPIIGLLVGMFGKMLSGMPVIGSVFAGITGPLGFIVGIFIAAWKNSQKFRDAVKELGGTVKDFFDAIFSVAPKKLNLGGIFKTIGDSLADGVTSLNDFLKTKSTEISGAVSKMWSGITNPKTIGNIQETGGKIFGTLGKVLSGIIGVIIEVATDSRVRNAISQIVNSLSSMLTTLAGVFDNGGTQSIGSSIASFIAIMGTAISGIITITAKIIVAIQKIVQTPIFKAFAGFMKTAAQIIVNNSWLFSAAIGVLGAVFIGIKIFRFLKSIGLVLLVFQKFNNVLRWVGLLNNTAATAMGGVGLGTRIGNFFRAIGSGIAAAIRAIPGIMQALMQAAPYIIGGIAAAALIIGELAALGWLMEKLHVGEGLLALGRVLSAGAQAILNILGTLVNGIVDIVVRNAPVIAAAFMMIFNIMKPALSMALSFVLQVLTIIANTLRDTIVPIVQSLFNNIGVGLSGLAAIFQAVGGIIKIILQGIATIISSVFTGIAKDIDAFGSNLSLIISSLASDGAAAATNALALAAGLAAVVASMAGGTLATGAAGIGSSLLSLGKGAVDYVNPFNKGQNSSQGQGQQAADPVAQITQLVGTLSQANNLVNTLQFNWNDIATRSLTIGGVIIKNIATSITTGIPLMTASLTAGINQMLDQAQAQLNARPLTVSIVNPDISTTGATQRNYAGQTVNKTSNNNFNINNPNPDVVVAAIANAMR